MEWLIGCIVGPDGRRWEVYEETSGIVSVQCDAPNGMDDDAYASLYDLKDSLAEGYRFEGLR